MKKGRVKINRNKSIRTAFTLKLGLRPNITLNNTPIPTSDTVRYLGLILDKRLTRNKRIRTKRLSLNARTLGPLLIRNK